jgi:Flp pilus assembly pilin Flp
MPTGLKSWVVDESGPDLIEYAFLAAVLATAGVLALQAIGPAVANTYDAWIDPSTGTPSLWEPGTPGGSGS